MAVMRQSITFGGVNSADFDLYIGGEGTFNAPKRAVEVVEVPGRNGAIVIDKGHFENIEVSYTVINQEQDLATFSQKLAGFRNALGALRGYQRLSDTFHPDEFREALFVDDFEVKPIDYATASEFTIKFNCKPQRYLVSGETSVVVADGETLNNPTLFESEPLLAIKGSGLVKFNGYEINIVNPLRGEVTIVEPQIYTYVDGRGPGHEYPEEESDPAAVANVDDDITINSATFFWILYLNDDYEDGLLRTVTVTDSGALGGTTTIMARATRELKMRTVLDPITLETWPVNGGVTYTHEVSLNVTYNQNGTTQTVTLVNTFNILSVYSSYRGNKLFDEYYDEQGASSYWPLGMMVTSLSTTGTTVDSTVYLLGDPTYLDCELGEAYKIENGEIISLNQHIDMGSRLPRLVSGDTEFELTGNITECKVTPRWWKL
jgi:phage-related protein